MTVKRQLGIRAVNFSTLLILFLFIDDFCSQFNQNKLN